VQVSRRFVSEIARFITGIEIHPGAKIGRRLFIDHGWDRDGQTVEIGDDVLLYQGVTSAAPASRRKRHPTLEDHVMVSAARR